MALIEPGVVTELHNLANELEIVYGTTRHREYIPKNGGIRVKRKGNIVYLLLDSDVHAAEGAPVIKLDYRLITDPHAGSPSTLVTILLSWLSGSVGASTAEIEGNTYIGKSPGRNGDFDVSYSSAHVIHIDTHPNVRHELEDDDIEYVRQINTSTGKVIEVFDRDNCTMEIVGDFLTISSANFNPTDSFVVVTNLLKHVYVPDLEFMNSYIGKPAGQNGDFTASYHNFHMIHFSDFHIGDIVKIYSEDIVQIVVLDKDDNVYLNITHDEFDIHTTVNGVQVDGNEWTDVAFQPTDRFIVYTNIPRKIVGRYNNVQTLVTNSIIGYYDDLWRDQGIEIDCRGYNIISLWCVLQANGSVGNQLKVLSKHTGNDVDEYRLTSYTSYMRSLGDDNIKIKFDFNLNNTTPYVQIQTRTVGVKGTTSSSTTTTAPNYVPGRIWVKYTLGY